MSPSTKQADEQTRGGNGLPSITVPSVPSRKLIDYDTFGFVHRLKLVFFKQNIDQIVRVSSAGSSPSKIMAVL